MRLASERTGEGLPTVLLHGLTATRKYVVMGSKTLQRSGHDVLAYDARGHGESDPPADRSAYTYADLAGDVGRQMDAAGFRAALLVGSSMGAHTAVRFALDRPDRVSGLVLITPAYVPGTPGGEDYSRWDARAEGLRSGGVDGFIAADDELRRLGPMQDLVTQVVRQRLSLHRHPGAVADALVAVPRSKPFGSIAELSSIQVPVLVVGDRDELDPGHPLAIAEQWAAAIPRAGLLVEPPGERPLAWQGGAISRAIAQMAEDEGLR